ncbi:PorP/SprF family type IX secretion system membrane protein [Neotamlana laminarinivorans]|uniref:PorP/SprF family type IX secretion system membrane protein n=1 Tax=Neotamlana laminarinivorans TaxID=2883124 RepID=A0A9X1L1S5_9FLAO|nr:PorP/SprF family type IX secretion system membrane protein [Tamlana laminarinivorans]MCB4799048.1 PorP/SprF family type IX secretion system membrane protein [Tamlana laminarinivorans]
MKIYTKKVLLILIFVVATVSAQQSPLFSEYNHNPFIINSAYAGLSGDTEVTLSNNGYFGNFDGAPRTLSFSGHGSLNNEKLALGAGIVRDELGVTKSTNVFAAFSYKIFFDFKSSRPYWQHYSRNVLSFGLTAGLQQFQDNLTELNIINDPEFANDVNTSIPTMGLSLLYNNALFYAGFSVPNVIGDELASEQVVRLSSPVYGYVGYRFFSNKFDNIMLKPNILIKHENGAPLQADFNLSVSVRNKFEFGGGYRTSSSFNLLAGVYLIKNIRFIYFYNIATNNSPLGNSYGISLSIKFNEGYQL